MSLPSKLNKAIRLTTRARGALRSSRPLFLMSHMRSRSSMLSHVLGSHERILGYYEMSRSYRERRDLTRMKIDLLIANPPKPRAIYCQDKLLHDHYVVGDSILANGGARVLFLVRDPAATLRSMLELGKRREVPDCDDPARAADYYIGRLKSLETFAERLEGDFLFVESDALIDQTNAELDRITNWLELDSPLTAEYDRFSHTGVGRYGDTSDNILRGVIHDNRAPENHGLAPALLDPAMKAYHSHVAFMNSRAK